MVTVATQGQSDQEGVLMNDGGSGAELCQVLPQAAREVLLRHASCSQAFSCEILVHNGDAVSGVLLVLQGTLRVFGLHASEREAMPYRVVGNQMGLLSPNSAFSSTRSLNRSQLNSRLM